MSASGRTSGNRLYDPASYAGRSEMGHAGIPRDEALEMRREGLAEKAGLVGRDGRRLTHFVDEHGDPVGEEIWILNVGPEHDYEADKASSLSEYGRRRRNGS